MKTVFTTGEAAKICKVSQQTIIRCFDSGQLKGFRVPGGAGLQTPAAAPVATDAQFVSVVTSTPVYDDEDEP